MTRPINDTIGRSTGHVSRAIQPIPRLIALLDRIVSAYAPGGRVAWNRRKGGSKPKGRRMKTPPDNPSPIKGKLHHSLHAQSRETREILFPEGRLLSRDKAQFALALLLQIEESYPRFFEQVPFDSQLSLVKTLNGWKPHEVVKKAKALTVWGFARLMRQDLPDVPNPGECRCLGFTGKASQWIRNLFVRRSNHTNVRFFWGLLQGVKRACAPIDEGFIHEAYEKHRRALTMALGPQEFDDLEAMRFGHRLWKGAQSASNESPPPSFSASYHSGRASGGKLAEIREIGTTQEVGLTDQGGEMLRVFGRVTTTGEAVNDYLQSGDRMRTRVQMVIEPLKARPITAGSASGSWACMRAQRKMWNHLRRLPQFALIGETLQETHLNWVQDKSPSGFDYWVSGDYSAATDNLDIRLTRRLFESFLYWTDFDDDLETVLREMLYEQTLCYPHDGSESQQTNGQLMGSPLSFPILCAANLFCYVQTWRRVFGSVPPLKDLPVLINGDDILFKSSTEFYEVWQDEIKKVGFELSVGKSYFSKKFLTVNSKLYVCKGTLHQCRDPQDPSTGCDTKCDVKPTLVTFFNPAQVLPGHYVNDESHNVEQCESDPLVGRLSDALTRASDPRHALARFKYFNKKLVHQATQFGRLNLLIHRNLGGVGVIAPDGIKIEITRFQRQLATVLHSTRQAGVVRCTRSVESHGFMTHECAYTAVRATVPPAPSPSPSKFATDLDRSVSRFWEVSNVPYFGPEIRMKNANLMSNDEILSYIGCTEIEMSLKNEEILSDQSLARSLGTHYGYVKGSVVGVMTENDMVWKPINSQCHLDSI